MDLSERLISITLLACKDKNSLLYDRYGHASAQVPKVLRLIRNVIKNYDFGVAELAHHKYVCIDMQLCRGVEFHFSLLEVVHFHYAYPGVRNFCNSLHF